MRTVTLYHDPKQQVLHSIMAEVDETTGAHTVVESTIEPKSPYFSLLNLLHTYQIMMGPSRVRAYTITELE